MNWGAALNIGGSLLEGATGFFAAKSAEKRQRQAVNEANQRLQGGLDSNLADLSGYRGMGSGATDRLSLLLGLGGDQNDPAFGSLLRDFSAADYQEDPGYQFRLRQGEQAINRNALAKGRYNAGSTLKALQGFNSGLASQEFGNAFERWRAQRGDQAARLGGAVDVGRWAVGTGNADRSAVTGQIADNIIGKGNASAASRIAQGNALGSALSGGTDWASRMLPTKKTPSPYTPDGF